MCLSFAIIPTFLEILLATTSICLFQCKFEDKITPKNLVSCCWLMGILLINMFAVKFLLLPKIKYDVFVMFRDSRLDWNHSVINNNS